MTTRGKYGAVKDRDPQRAAELYAKRDYFAFQVDLHDDQEDEQVKLYLEKCPQDSVYKEMADVFIQTSAAYGLSSAFVLAVAEHESNRGRSNAAKTKNNLYGIQPQGEDGPLSKFNTLDECIDSFCSLIYNSYVVKHKQRTVVDIADNPQNAEGHSYCGEHHDSVSRLDWIEGICGYIGRIQDAQ